MDTIGSMEISQTRNEIEIIIYMITKKELIDFIISLEEDIDLLINEVGKDSQEIMWYECEFCGHDFTEEEYNEAGLACPDDCCGSRIGIMINKIKREQFINETKARKRSGR